MFLKLALTNQTVKFVRTGISLCTSRYSKRISFLKTPSSYLIFKKQNFSTFNEHNNNNSNNNSFLAQKLENRNLIKLNGPDVVVFLQGLVTNDVRLLEQSKEEYTAMYCMMLNVQGRVLYDLLLYKIQSLFKDEFTIFIECEKTIRGELISMLQKYKLRKKVSIAELNEFSVWAIIPKMSSTVEDKPNENFRQITQNDQKALILVEDPRITSFGYRMVSALDKKAPDLLENCHETSDQYTLQRLKLGLSEGAQDLPPANSFPLESNLYFLNGVSFNKGCYIGQELTARTHHTGVIRKRLMPLISNDSDPKICEENMPLTVYSETKKKVCGKVRSWYKNRGIGLLRLEECLTEPTSLVLQGCNGERIGHVKTYIPYWWDREDEVIKQVLNKIDKKTK